MSSDDEFDDLVANDPALRQLIAESAWQSVIDADKNDDHVMDCLLDERPVPEKDASSSADADANAGGAGDGALGIRRDENGKLIMHVDPAGVFFGGGGDDPSRSAALQSQDHDDDEAFDYEMSPDDVAFYEELREMAAARDRLSEMVEKQRQENAQRAQRKQLSPKKSSVSADVDAAADGDEEEQEEDSTDGDAETEEFLQKMKLRTADLYVKFIDKKKELEERRRVEVEKKKNRRRGAAAAGAASGEEQQQSSMLVEKKHRAPPAVAQLIKEIKQEQQQQQQESGETSERKMPQRIEERAPEEILKEAEEDAVRVTTTDAQEDDKAEEEESNRSSGQERNKPDFADTDLVLDLMKELQVVSDECLDSAIALVEAEFAASDGQEEHRHERRGEETATSAGTVDADAAEAAQLENDQQQEEQQQQEHQAESRKIQEFFTDSDSAELRLFSDARRDLAQRQLDHAAVVEASSSLSAPGRTARESTSGAGTFHRGANQQGSKLLQHPTRVVDQILLPETEIVTSSSTSFAQLANFVAGILGGEEDVVDANAFGRPPSASAVAGSGAVSSFGEKKEQQQQPHRPESAAADSNHKKTDHDRQRRLGQRRLFRQNRESSETKAMSSIDQQQQRTSWMAERSAAELAAAMKEIVDAEVKARMAVRSEESTRSHDLRIRETRQRAILSEWQQHQRQQAQTEQRSTLVDKAEPGLRQKLRDVESVAWVEIFTSFEDQRKLLAVEEENKRAERARLEREEDQRRQQQLESDWAELQKTATAQLSKCHQKQQQQQQQEQKQQGHDQISRQHFDDSATTDSLQLQELLRVALGNLASCRFDMACAARDLSNVTEVAKSAARSSIKENTSAAAASAAAASAAASNSPLSPAATEFLSSDNLTLASASTSSLSHDAVASEDILRLLPEKVTAAGASVVQVNKSFAGLQDVAAASASVSDRSQAPALKFFCEKLNVLLLDDRLRLSAANSSASSVVSLPSIPDLEQACAGLVAVDFSNSNNEIKFTRSSSSSFSSEQKNNSSSGTNKRGAVRFLNVSGCGLNSLDDDAILSPSLAVLVARNCPLSSAESIFSVRSAVMLSSLVVLDVQSCQLSTLDIVASSGSSSSSLAVLPSLQKLNAAENRLAGPLPEWLLRHVTLRELDLSDNRQLAALSPAAGKDPIVWPLLQKLDLRGTAISRSSFAETVSSSIFFIPCLRQLNGEAANFGARSEQLLGKQRCWKQLSLFKYLHDTFLVQDSLQLPAASSASLAAPMDFLLRALACHRSVTSIAVDAQLVQMFAPGAQQHSRGSKTGRRPSSAASASAASANAPPGSDSQENALGIFMTKSIVQRGPAAQVAAAMEMQRAALLLCRWWRRNSTYRVLAERAQRRIAPVWRGAWTRMRLKKVDGDDLFDIPDGNAEDLLAGIPGAGGASGGGVGVVEVIRRGQQQQQQRTPVPPSVPAPPSAGAATPSRAGGSLFVIRSSNNNDPLRAATPMPVAPASAKGIRSANPFPPAASSAPGHAAAAVQRSNSASIMGGANRGGNKNNKNSNDNDDDGDEKTAVGEEDSGWSDNIKDLLKYRERKRKAQVATRERQEWLKSGFPKKK